MNEQVQEVRVDPRILGQIRRATIDDLPFATALMDSRYGGRFREPEKRKDALGWMAGLFDRRDYTCLRGERSAGIARAYYAYGTEPHAQVVALAAYPDAGFEPLRILRVMVLWARALGVPKLMLSEDTGVNFEPFAKRLGGSKIVKVMYQIPTE